MQNNKKLYNNFNNAGRAYIEKQSVMKREVREAILEYSKWLDGFQVFNGDLEIAMLRKARELDREIILSLINKMGPKESEKVLRPIVKKHEHFHERYEQGKRGGIWSWMSWYWTRITKKDDRSILSKTKRQNIQTEGGTVTDRSTT